MATILLGRLTLGPPSNFITEPLGDPVGTTGGSVVAAPRTVQQVEMDLNTIITGATTVAQAQAVRRQLRSMLQNTPLKMQAFLYFQYSDDTEQNGWLVPAPANMISPDNVAWKSGMWMLQGAQWYLAGRKRGIREARSVWMKDLRMSSSPGPFERDYLGWIVSQDFSSLPVIPLTILSNGATGISNAVNGQVPPSVAMPTGRDGGVCQLVYGPQLPTTATVNPINPDLAALGYERAESALNLSDVIVYDRRGQITAPSTGPDTSWEEVYGSDYPWNWTTGGANDSPVFDNGLTRVRWDSTNTPGFRVDIWNGAAYVEQGKYIIQRVGDSTGYCDTYVFASLVDWTPDRATMCVVLSRAADAYSQERVYITVERGQLGATFEVYPALTSGSTAADVALQWTPALNSGVADFNNSVFKVDSQALGTTVAAGSNGVNVNTFAGAGTLNVASTLNIPATGSLLVLTSNGVQTVTYTGTTATTFTGCTCSGSGTLATGNSVVYVTASWIAGQQGSAVMRSTAGTGAGTGNSGQFGVQTTLGASSFANSENWVALLRYPTTFNGMGSYQTTFVVLQAANAFFATIGSSTSAYGVAQDSYLISSQNSAGYIQCQIQFGATQAQQILEAESMTLGTGTSITVDNPGSPNNASGTGSNSTVTTRTTDGNAHVTSATWPNGFLATYRVFARVRVSGGTGSFYAKTGATTGVTITTTSTTYVELDLGEITANNTTLEIHAWNSGANNTFVDRVEAVLVQDRARTTAIFSGSRDAGQAALMDSRTVGALVAR